MKLKWSIVISIVILITSGIYYYHRGYISMVKDPPRVIAEKLYGVESHSYSCGQNCVFSSNDNIFNLISTDGGICHVTRKEWNFATKGMKWKCMNLFGWDD